MFERRSGWLTSAGGTMTFVDRVWLRLPLVMRAVLLARRGYPAVGRLDVGEHPISTSAAVGRPAHGDHLWLYWRYFVRALNRFHFRKDAVSLAAWKIARDVVWPAQDKEATPIGGEALEHALLPLQRTFTTETQRTQRDRWPTEIANRVIVDL